MTTEQFHNALLQGRGSCVLAARKDPEKYRDEVLWACRELVAFDSQCEGSRAWLIYQLVCLYPDRTPFVKTACDALIACPSDGDWRVDSLAELLALFFQDGDQPAWKALMAKYRQLYHQMRHVGPPADRCYWAERDDYERLCVILAWNREYFLDIARDLGRLSLETEWLKEYEFDWFYHCGRRYLRSLTKAAERDALLAEFLRVHEAAWQELQAPHTPRRSNRLPRNCRDADQLNAALEKYLSARTPEEKIKALDAFHWTPYPGDPAPIIADSQSDHDNLHNAALAVLKDICHPAVREYARQHLDETEGFAAFCTNYEKGDESLLMDRLRSIPVDFECTTSWHGDQMAVRNMKKPPKEALRYIFDTTYCSWCRWDTLTEMGKRRMLTPALLEECQYDSNGDIRAYARRCLNRRKSR